MILFENVNRSDARKLAEWWNENTPFYHFAEPHPDLPRRYQVIRQEKEPTTPPKKGNS